MVVRFKADIRDLNAEPAGIPFAPRALPVLTEKPIELQAEGWGQQVAALKMRAEKAEVRAEHLKRELDAANDQNKFLGDRLEREAARADRYQKQVNRVEAVAEGIGSQVLRLMDEMKADKPTPAADEQKMQQAMEGIANALAESDEVAERG